MKNFKLLIVEDDNLVSDALYELLNDQWDIEVANSAPEVNPENLYHVALVDLNLSGKNNEFDGLEVMQNLINHNSQIEIIAMSGHINREVMEASLEHGASRFLAKPLNPNEVTNTFHKLHSQLQLLKNSHPRNRDQNFIGTSKSWTNLLKQIAQLKSEPGPILIEGASGTGKEVVATLLHQQEGEGRPMIVVNIAAIPENLFEAELFGYVKGAFTGADSNRVGLIEAAHGGDLFLDEVEALSLNMQVKLLRFLESGEVKKLGDHKVNHVKVRTVLATNKNLEEMVQNKEFREDLLWRINGVKLNLPSLKERREDIQTLAQHFLKQNASRAKTLSEEAKQLMSQYSWPGNIRELKRVCEQLSLTSPLPIIRDTDVKSLLTYSQDEAPLETTDLSRGLETLVKEYEALIIQKILDKNRDIDEAAKQLRISRSNLYKKIKAYSLEWS
ncbi:MAG: sigma-54 dependent transcriptional regulator [Bdellovibrionales bacterium]|nr:sigma-54 dependent transcriptional regulator [Bdellovibrionales bacterium]